MRSQLEQAAILQKYQCCFAELAGSISSKLGKHKLCNLVNQLRDMKLARAYLYRVHKYYTMPYNYKSAVQVDIVRNNNEAVTITITVNGTDYSYTGNGDLATVISSLQTTLINAGFQVYDVDSDSFIFYTYDSSFDNPTVTCTNSEDTEDNSTSCSTFTASQIDELLDNENSLSRNEICGIINEMACILDPYCNNC